MTGFSGGNGTLIAQTLLTPGFQQETVTYHITPAANGCFGVPVDYTVTIDPQPHLLNSPMTQSICSDQTTAINLVSSCPNTTFSWNASLLSGSVSGFTNGTGSLIAQTLTNLLPVDGQVLYSIIPVAGSCTGSDFPTSWWWSNPCLTLLIILLPHNNATILRPISL